MILEPDVAERLLKGDLDVGSLYERWHALPRDDDSRLIEDVLLHLSTIVWAAGWLDGIEERVWELLRDGLGTVYVRDEDARAVDALLEEARATSERLGWWPSYDLEDRGGPSFVGVQVPLGEWRVRHPQ